MLIQYTYLYKIICIQIRYVSHQTSFLFFYQSILTCIIRHYNIVYVYMYMRYIFQRGLFEYNVRDSYLYRYMTTNCGFLPT